jgi:hypothetical protein
MTARLREMLKTGTLSPDVAQAALDALGHKRRRIAAKHRVSSLRSAETLSLGVQWYNDAVRKMGRHVVDSEHSEEERSLVRDLLGGHGTVFSRNGRSGARFESAGLLDMAEMSYKSMIYNFGSGGLILLFFAKKCP